MKLPDRFIRCFFLCFGNNIVEQLVLSVHVPEIVLAAFGRAALSGSEVKRKDFQAYASRDP